MRDGVKRQSLNHSLFSVDSCTHLDGWFKDPYEDTCYKDFGNGDYNTAITKCEFKGYEVLMPKTKRKHIFVQWFIKE